MRSGGGKQKGASFERDVCRRLSLWVSMGAMEDCFWRSAMSGGRSTVGYAKGKRMAAQAGDISSINIYGHPLINLFMIECKAYANLNYPGLLKGKGHLVEFWAEASKQAKRYDKMPLLIAKQNQMPVTACINSDGARLLELRSHSVLIAPKLDLRILLFDDFLKHGKQP